MLRCHLKRHEEDGLMGDGGDGVVEDGSYGVLEDSAGGVLGDGGCGELEVGDNCHSGRNGSGIKCASKGFKLID